MPWILLVFAIILEVLGTTCMKLSQGLTKFWPTVGMGAFYLLGFALLALSLKKIDLSVAYAIWSGLGTVFITMIGIGFFQEYTSWVKIACIVLIIAGVFGLNLSGSGQ